MAHTFPVILSLSARSSQNPPPKAGKGKDLNRKGALFGDVGFQSGCMTCTFASVLGRKVRGLEENTATLKGELWINTHFVLE